MTAGLTAKIDEMNRTQDVWLTGPAATKVLGVTSVKVVRKLAARGFVGVRRIPGTHPRYSRNDLQTIAARSVRPAVRRQAVEGSTGEVTTRWETAAG
jgi:predicted RNA binding protein YcfA (HicA-like mRNA interferase family)